MKQLAVILLFVLAVVGASPVQAQAVRLLMLGDSLTAGYGLPPQDALPEQLQKALRADGVDVTVINAGMSGDTTAGGKARLNWALADKPTHAIVALGANDMLRGLPVAQARANLDAIVAGLQAQGVKVMLAGMKAQINLGAAYGREFDAIYPDLAKEKGVPLYPFLLDGVAVDPALNQSDGLHPNARGVAVIIERMKPAVEAFLKS